jgi:hypothetical protein
MEITGQEMAAGAIGITGALGFDFRSKGVGPRRLPDWTRSQLPEMLSVMARMPSGVRLVFETDAREVILQALVTRIERQGEVAAAVFELESMTGDRRQIQVQGGNKLIIDPNDPSTFRVERGQVERVVFDNLPPGRKHLMLWLPHNAYVELVALQAIDATLLQPGCQTGGRWYHYGSSISHCMEAVSPADIWPAVAARKGGMSLYNLGFGGQCHLDPFVARTLRDSDAEFISIKVGINIINMDSMRERVFLPMLHGFIDTIRETKKDTPILLVSPIFCPSAEKHPGPTFANESGVFETFSGHEHLREGCMTLEQIRQLISGFVALRQDKNLAYLDGLSLFSQADGKDLPDALHPNPAGYIRMGDRFAAAVFSKGGILAQLTG